MRESHIQIASGDPPLEYDTLYPPQSKISRGGVSISAKLLRVRRTDEYREKESENWSH